MLTSNAIAYPQSTLVPYFKTFECISSIATVLWCREAIGQDFVCKMKDGVKSSLYRDVP